MQYPIIQVIGRFLHLFIVCSLFAYLLAYEKCIERRQVIGGQMGNVVLLNGSDTLFLFVNLLPHITYLITQEEELPDKRRDCKNYQDYVVR